MADVTLADLLKVPAPDLQRALTRVPNRLIAVALAGAEGTTAASLLRHISPRRRTEVAAEIGALGKVPRASSQTAVKNLLKKALGLQAEEVDAKVAGVSLGPAPPRRPRKPPVPLTAEDFEAFLLHLRKRHPLMKSAAEEERARAVRLLIERGLAEPRKE